ncbi:MAG: hypothetical protein AB8G86_19500 [Saprospiraceae bacterium]
MYQKPYQLALNQRNSIPSTNNGFADEQVIIAIKNSGGNSQLVLKWFFEDVKDYSLGVWRKKYRDIPNDAWEDIFTDATIKLITRVKKGLTLKEGTRLKSYFTSVVEYTVLDYFGKNKKEKVLPLTATQRVEASTDKYEFEESQMAELILQKLQDITENAEQVKVILLVAKGYKYKEIVVKTSYQSEGACRNAYLKGKKRIVNYLVQHPAEGKELKAMLMGNKL